MVLTKNKNYELVLPTDYVDINEDEMTYIDGGFYISFDSLMGIFAGAFGAGIGTTIAVPTIVAGIDAIAAGLATIPGLGWITGGLLVTNAAAFAVAATQAIAEHHGIHVRLGFPWGLSFSAG